LFFGPLANGATVQLEKTILLVGGSSSPLGEGSGSSSIYWFDPSEQTFKELPVGLAEGRWALAAATSPDGYVPC